MQSSNEWEMVQELNEILEEIDDFNAVDFIDDLFQFLDPNLPFLEQRSERQLDYLIYLHDKYCNGDEDAFEDWA